MPTTTTEPPFTRGDPDEGWYDPSTQNPFEVIQLVAHGDPFEGWESVTVTWEATTTYVTAQLTASELRKDGKYPDPQGDAFAEWDFPPGAEVTMFASGKPFITGYVNGYMPMATAEQHSVTVIVVTAGKDWAESSVETTTGNFEMTPDTGIAAALGLTRSLPGVTPEVVPSWQVRQGSSNFAETMRVLQPRQKILNPGSPPDFDPQIAARNPAFVNTQGNLIQGYNILQMSAKLMDNKYYQTKVLGQAQTGSSISDRIQLLQPWGIAMVPDIFGGKNSRPRERTQVIVDQESTNAALVQRRAQWEAMRSMGADTEAVITVPGWRDQGSNFWHVYSDVYVNAPYLQISCWMRIKKCVFRQSIATGTTTEITLVDPRVFGGAIPACNSGAPWNSTDVWQEISQPRSEGKKHKDPIPPPRGPHHRWQD